MCDDLKTVFMFPGQGSQYYQMGLSLYKENAVFRKTLDHLDDLVKSMTQYSVITAIYDVTKPITDTLDNLAITHPAIFMIQYAMVQTLKSMEILPDIVLGYSLGEYCALATAEVITPEEALILILKQVEILGKVCQAGFMYAILANYEKYLSFVLDNSKAELAAINFQDHFVVAGPISSEPELLQVLKSQNLLYFKLPIHYGFHSAAIEPAIEPIEATLNSVVFQKPKLSVTSSTISDFLDSIRNTHFCNVIRSTLRFQETLQFLENNGQYLYLDLGPSDTLSIFAKYIINQNSVSQVISTLSMQKKKYSVAELKSDLIK